MSPDSIAKKVYGEHTHAGTAGRDGWSHATGFCRSRARFAGLAIAVASAGFLLTGCPQQGPQGPTGPQGPAGATGPDGQLRIYGDGSAGDVTVTADSNLATLDAQGNLQFHNLTVNTRVTLTVPTGGVIRCTGSFVNNGTVQMGPGGAGGSGGSGTAAEANPGISRRAAGGGSTGPNTFIVEGGNGGLGFDLLGAMLIFDVQPGGGGGGYSRLDEGGDGGGGLLILAETSVVNAGTIIADGANGPLVGSGGGGGGIVILASPGSVSNTGTISAGGGNGGVSAFELGAGGGGGGGIVHFMSPTLDTASGTVDVGGGTGGAGGTITDPSRVGGGGGGASGGAGGRGGSIDNAPFNTANPGANGAAGYVIESLTDPTPWFN